MPTEVYSSPLLKHLIAEWLSALVLGRNRLVLGLLDSLFPTQHASNPRSLSAHSSSEYPPPSACLLLFLSCSNRWLHSMYFWLTQIGRPTLIISSAASLTVSYKHQWDRDNLDTFPLTISTLVLLYSVLVSTVYKKLYGWTVIILGVGLSIWLLA